MRADAQCEDLLVQARTQDTSKSLVALGEFVTGQPCYLAHGGIALRGIDDTGTEIRDAAGNLSEVGRGVFQDHGLKALGVEAVKLQSGASVPLDRRALVGGLVWRAGLLLKMLDTSFAHLSGRVSGGQKTLQHQLVKATFTECFSIAEQVRLEAPLWLENTGAAEASEVHDMLTSATTRAAKLMGGHGYLRGSLNGLECLSLCLSALLRDSAQLQGRAAA